MHARDRTPTSFRRSLLSRMVLLTLMTSGAILLASFVVGTHQSLEIRSRSLVETGTRATSEALERVFGRVAQNLRIARGWGASGLLDPHDAERLNRLFRPLVREHEQISSMLVADQHGDEWMLLQRQDGFVNRLSRPGEWGKTTRWLQWDSQGALVDESERELDYDARRRPWHRGAMATPQAGEIHWTAPYTFFTTQDPGITASMRLPARNGRVLVVAFDVQIRDLSRFTTGIVVAKHGGVLVLADDDTVVGLPGLERFREPEALRRAALLPASELGLPWLGEAMVRSRAAGAEGSGAFFSVDGGSGLHWVGVRSFDTGAGQVFRAFAFVPRADLLAELRGWRVTVLVVTLLALVLAFALAARSATSYSRPLLRLSDAASRVRDLDLAAKASDAHRAPNPAGTHETSPDRDWERDFRRENIGESGIREIDALTTTFEHMARELSRKTRELSDHSRTLEDKVLERTRDLRDANHQLRATLAQVQDMQEQLVLREKMASLGNLVAGVAHEINNPVGAVASASQNIERCIAKLEQALSSEKMDGTRRERLIGMMRDNAGVITEGSGRVASLVKSLRRFSRVDQADWQDVDLHEGLESTLILLQHMLRGRRRVEKDFGELPTVTCMPGQINQVFMNLLVNAIQATEAGDTIRIETRREGDAVAIAVVDTGKGIDPAVRDKVFDPGFTTKGVGVGTGLGLSISYKIVQEHGGSIQLESQPGRGATFTVRLPIEGRGRAGSEAAPAESPDGHRAPASGEPTQASPTPVAK